MSFISQIVAAADENQLNDLNTVINEITYKIDVLKPQVKEYLEKEYLHYHPVINSSDSFLKRICDELDTALLEFKPIELEIKSTSSSLTKKVEALSSQEVECRETIRLLQNLLLVDELMNSSKSIHFDNENYAKAAQSIRRAKEILESEHEYNDFLEVYVALQSQLLNKEDELSYDVKALWKKSIQWNKTTKKLNKTVTLKIDASLNKIHNILDSLWYYQCLEAELFNLSKIILEDVFSPVISKQCEVSVEENDDYMSLSVHIQVLSKGDSLTSVLSNLMVVFNFLKKCFQSDNVSVAPIFGDQVGDLFVKTLFDNCLRKTIPTTKDALERYDATMQSIRTFELELRNEGFLKDGNVIANEFSVSSDDLYNKWITKIQIEKAEALMKKDLHQMIPVEKSTDESKKYFDETSNITTEVKNPCYSLAPCQISQSTEDILKLIKLLTSEAMSVQEDEKLKMLAAARSICSLYVDHVPELHAKLLDDIPLYSALLYSNCVFLVYSIIQFERGLKISNITSHMPLLDNLMVTGSKILKCQTEKQMNQLKDILLASGLGNLSELEVFPQSIEKAIRQCLRQLTLLLTVWGPVLPDHVYSKIMGQICDSMIEAIVDLIVRAQDIRANVCDELVDVLTLVVEKLPSVFTCPKEIVRYVDKWAKLDELVRILQGTLLTIEERWAYGKGPLAEQFTVDQIRTLIRALFQVSDRRAAVLAKIV